jgi:adenosylcobinamide-phosphate synthase
MDEAMRCTVETVSEGTVNKVVSPIFYMLIFGGMGGVICCAVNTVAEVVGNHTAERIHIGKYPSMLADGVNYIPTRIAAVIMQFSVDYFLLDKERSERIFKRDRDKSLGLNSGYPQSICAGALGIELSGVEYYNGQPVEKPVIGTFTRPLEAYDVYWTNHIMMGTAAYAMMFAALIKIVIFLVFKIVF